MKNAPGAAAFAPTAPPALAAAPAVAVMDTDDPAVVATGKYGMGISPLGDAIEENELKSDHLLLFRRLLLL